MGLGERLRRIWGTAVGEPYPDGLEELHVGDPRFDEWEAVRDFEELETARAFRQAVAERGLEAVLTADWPLDRFGRGDIALRVPPGSWSKAEELLDGLEADD
jgi:hypothetical protein